MNSRYLKTVATAMALGCSMSVMAQNKIIKGTVVDETGEPVIGATVRVEGSKKATVTDMDGNYKIDAPSGKKITISYLGYKDATTTGGTL